MVFPGLINELPPLTACSIAAAIEGHQVVVLAAGCRGDAARELESYGVIVRTLGLEQYPRPLAYKILLRIKFAAALWKELKRVTPTVCWYHGAYGMAYRRIARMLGRGRMHEVAHVHELHDREPIRRRTQYETLRTVGVAIFPEATRAAIAKVESGARAKMFVIPNRGILGREDIGELDVRKVFLAAGGHESCSKFLLYQGLIAPERCILQLVRAFRGIESRDIGLILMGPTCSKHFHLQVTREKEGDARIVLIEPMPAPSHLAITKQCTWGALLYAPTSLNNVFCAPNKVYEYAAAGLGMLLPDYPGMRRLAERFDLGVLVDTEDVTSIRSGLQVLIHKDRMAMKSAAAEFLETEPDVLHFYREVFEFLRTLTLEDNSP